MAAWAGEQRKTVTVLFCDVVGSTALGETADPEALRALLARYFERMKSIVERHGGTVEKFIGDAVMAVFGVPTVHEDDAARAVQAAAEMRAAFPGLGLEGRIGIETGEVVTGTEERLATGDAVNTAARLQQAAAPGEILLGTSTYTLARDAATVEPLAPLELKGKREPVDVFRLIAAHALPERTLRAAFVGRERELGLLASAWHNACASSRCELVTVIGDAGLGKTRLVTEALAGLDGTVVRGRCLSYGEGITYWPAVEVIKQLRALPSDPAAAAAIGALLGEADGGTSAEQLAWAFRKLLEEQARVRPVAVWFEDLHWAEETFLDLVEHIALLARDAPILLLCTARPELLDRRPAWPAPLRLEPLASSDAAHLVPEAIEPALRERIVRAAAGNPLYVTELAAMARERNDFELPASLRALLAARVDQLDVAERRVLERGAVEGELFHRGAVQALAPEETQVTTRLAALVRRDLVQPDRPQIEGEDGFRFRHVLIRDAAYDALPKAARADLHERFADWVSGYGSRLVELDEIVGYHLEQAYRYASELGDTRQGVAERACVRLTTASRTASARGDLAAAASLLRRAAKLTATDRPALLLELGNVLFARGNFVEAAASFGEALELAERSGDACLEAQARMWAAAISTHHGDEQTPIGDVIRLADEAEALLEERGDDGRALAAVLIASGRNRHFAGRGREAEAVLGKGLEQALRARDVHAEAECVRWSLTAKSWGAAPSSELELFMLSLRPELHLALSALPIFSGHRGMIAARAGDFAAARASFADAAAAAAELGMDATSGAQMRGLVELMAGDPAAAERRLREGYDRYAELGEIGFRSTAGVILADALVRLDRDEEAEAILDEGVLVPDDLYPQARDRAVRAQILARRGEAEAAERLIREALAIVEPTDYIELHGEVLLAFADIARRAKREDEAETSLLSALELFERKENRPLAERTRRLLAAAASQWSDR